ncbi:C40 family peptidase [Escherichia coli]
MANNDLRRGDCCFSISTAGIADHMGVYLGDGQFIESPRTGETIRVSRLAEPFWQDHFLGARRILTGRDDFVTGKYPRGIRLVRMARGSHVLTLGTKLHVFTSRCPNESWRRWSACDPLITKTEPSRFRNPAILSTNGHRFFTI